MENAEERIRWDVERWDGKHRAARGSELVAPDGFVLERLEAIASLGELEGARALDLACGRGRHALELLRRGALVEAWDFSAVALEELGGLDERITVRNVTLGTDTELPANGFEVVVLVNYLDRALFERWSELVAPGGHLLYTTFTTERQGTRPPLRFCLDPGELESGFSGFETLATFEAGGRAGLHARRAEGAT